MNSNRKRPFCEKHIFIEQINMHAIAESARTYVSVCVCVVCEWMGLLLVVGEAPRFPFIEFDLVAAVTCAINIETMLTCGEVRMPIPMCEQNQEARRCTCKPLMAEDGEKTRS